VRLRSHVTPGGLVVAGVALLGLTAILLWLLPSGNYMYLPDRIRPVAPAVAVKGGHAPTDGGGVYYVDVIVRRATEFENLFRFIHPDATYVPASAVNPPGASDKTQHQLDLREMTRSQAIAAAVALRKLGYHVVAKADGALIDFVAANDPAAAKLLPTDVIVSVDGRPVRTPEDLHRLLGLHKPGDHVRVAVRRGGTLRTYTLGTVPNPSNPRQPLIGVVVEQSARIHLPIPVSINAGQVGGPSAGLAFALDLMEELGRDVDRGHRIAATGELALDGSVLPIGGVKQKTIAARRGKVDVFLVPAGDNATEARRYAHGLRIIPVSSFQQALHALATLPRTAA
jgi:PDZ domain-containing protein